MNTFSRLLWLSLLSWLAASCAAQPSRTSGPGQPPKALMLALERGINLPIWFTYRGQADIDPAQWYPDAADWQRLVALGFGHVRVQFDPAYFRDSTQPATVQASRIAELRGALAPAWAAGLVVVLAAEPRGPEKSRLVADAAGQQELELFWRDFAMALRDVRPDQLVFELLNEPTDTDAARNRALMRKLADAVRAVAPEHTLVVEGHGYSGIGELLAFEPLSLPNLVYSFHFYESHTFTHQGAFWGWPMFLKFRDLPYPSSPAALKAHVDKAEDDAKPHLVSYGEQRWKRSRIAQRLDLVEDWATSHGVAVWCGEFGVSRLGPPLAARRAWLGDVRRALQGRDIGWAVFDYAGHFGLVTGNAGARQLDPQDAKALGLRTTAP